MKMTKKILMALISAQFTCACVEKDDLSPQETQTLCEQVVDKIASCLGARVPLESCSGESADFILRSDCEDVLNYIKGEIP